MSDFARETQDQSNGDEPESTVSLAGAHAFAKARKRKIAFFGWFGQGNLGNDITLQAILRHLRSLAPDDQFSCISDRLNAVAATYDISPLPSRTFTIKALAHCGSLVTRASILLTDIGGELRQWLYSVKVLRTADALIVPGTGLLTDAYTLLYWGPYDMFRWSVAAKLCRCKLLFVSVGAGPIYGRGGRFFVKTALSLADYRSYRDESTRQQLEGIGFRAHKDPVYPDLAFSLPRSLIPLGHGGGGRRRVVGLGLMVYAGKYGVESPAGALNRVYLGTLAEFAKWLLAHDYDVRLLIGDLTDTQVTQEFKALLKDRSVFYDDDRISDAPIVSVEDLLEQLAATDLVVATRFHNVVLALLLAKPVIAVSFHHKCASLMSQMGLSEYCQDINQLTLSGLIAQFSKLDQNADAVKQVISERVGACRDMLDEQYAIIAAKM
jgi:polysaccharide pyruvyl transferase WcaK-like protein